MFIGCASVSKMKIVVSVLLLSFLKVCVTLEHVWHSYQYDPTYKSRQGKDMLYTNQNLIN